MIEKDLIPKHWEVKKLGEVCKTTSGGTPSRKNESYYQGDIPWVKSGELDKGLIIDTEEKITKEAIENSSAKIFPRGTLLIALYGATIGKLAFLGIEAATNQAICGIYENENISSKYLYYFLLFEKRTLIKQGIGGAQPNISQGILKDLEVPLPELKVQQSIVSKIEQLFSELDKGKQQLELAQQQLKVYRQAVLKWAFEGKLTNKDVKEGKLPEGWKTSKISEIGSVSGGITKNANRENLELKLPFLRVGNVYFDRLDLEEIHTIGLKQSEVQRVKLEKHDLLFVEGNGSLDQIGRVALWNGQIENCVHQNHLIKVRLSDKVLPKYVLHFFCSSSGRNNIKEKANSTSGLHTLNLGKINKLELPICSIEEQIQIVREIESRLSVCDKLEETITNSLKQAETLRQSILKKAFEGKLVETVLAEESV